MIGSVRKAGERTVGEGLAPSREVVGHLVGEGLAPSRKPIGGRAQGAPLRVVLAVVHVLVAVGFSQGALAQSGQRLAEPPPAGARPAGQEEAAETRTQEVRAPAGKDVASAPGQTKEVSEGRPGAAAEPPASAPVTRGGDAGEPLETFPLLPPDLRPGIQVRLEPAGGVKTGELATLTITVDARPGDDVTVPDQGFGELEVHEKDMQIDEAQPGRKRYLFRLDLLALRPGEQRLDPVELRVVAADGTIGRVETEPFTISVRSRLGNEPDAQLKPPSEPVVVMQDDYTLLYLGGGLLAAVLIAALAFWFSLWWQRRPHKGPPPPPPRPPWEVALQKLAELQRLKAEMLSKGEGTEFVDRVSDVVREYLGGRFFGGEVVFDGLETTSEEMIETLRRAQVPAELLSEVSAYLYRCDLIKFAKVVPDGEEAEGIWRRALDIVRVSTPAPGAAPPSAAASEGTTPSGPPTGGSP